MKINLELSIKLQKIIDLAQNFNNYCNSESKDKLFQKMEEDGNFQTCWKTIVLETIVCIT